MTKTTIERLVERLTDELDRQYLTTAMPTAEYKAGLAIIDRWADLARREARSVPA